MNKKTNPTLEKNVFERRERGVVFAKIRETSLFNSNLSERKKGRKGEREREKGKRDLKMSNNVCTKREE